MATRSHDDVIDEIPKAAFSGLENVENAISHRIENAAEVSATPTEIVEFDIDGILPRDDAPALVFGPPAALKSWLALAICDAVTKGTPFAGLSTHRRPRALYVNLDAGPKSFRNRVRAISTSPTLDFLHLTSSEFSGELLRELLSQYRGGFVVLDCLASIYKPDVKQDPGHAMRAFTDDLRALYAEFDCGGLVIDHPHRPKEIGSDGDFFGSIQKLATFRTMWSVIAEPKDEETTTRRVKIACRKMSEGQEFSPFTIAIDFGERVVIRKPLPSDAFDRERILDEKIIAWAAQQDTTFTKRTVEREVLGQRVAYTRSALDKLIAAGTFVATGKKRGNGDLYRFNSPSASADGTHSDARDAIKSVSMPGSASASPIFIGDALSGTHSGTHSEAFL